MARTARPLSFIATLMLIALALLVPSTAASATDSPAAKVTAAPKVGQCFNVTLRGAGAVALKQAPFACSRRHTLWVIKSATVPSNVPLDPARPAFQTFQDKVCKPAIKRALGNNRGRYAKSAYALFTFLPTATQRAAGARWLTCTIGAVKSPTALQVSTARVPMKVTRTLPKRLRMCVTKGARYTSCASPHTFHATYSWTVYGALTRAAAIKRAKTVCPRHVRRGGFVWAMRTIRPSVLVCFSR